MREKSLIVYIVYNIKNIVNFLKENVDDITAEELSNTKISFTYLNTFTPVDM